MANSGRKPEQVGQLVNELEQLRSESQRVRRKCDEARESLREAWQSLGRAGKLEEGLSNRRLSRVKDKRTRRAKLLKANSHNEAED